MSTKEKKAKTVRTSSKKEVLGENKKARKKISSDSNEEQESEEDIVSEDIQDDSDEESSSSSEEEIQPLSRKTSKRIKGYLDNSNLEELKKILKKELLVWEDEINRLNIFDYACLHSDLDIIDYIVDHASTLNKDEQGELLYSSTFPIIAEECEVTVTSAFTILARFDPQDSNNVLKKLQDLGMETVMGFDDSSKKDKKLVLRDYVKSRTGHTQSGNYSVHQSKMHRLPRSFTGERERQLLKQFSTMLLFHFNKINKEGKLTEVETMHVKYDNRDYLFVAGNEAGMTKIFKPSLDLKNILATDNNPEDKEGKTRFKRYKSNFKNLFEEKNYAYEYTKKSKENKWDIKHYKEVVDLLRTHQRKQLTIKPEYELGDGKGLALTSATQKNILKTVKDETKIIFIDTSQLSEKSNLKSRHAEEFLTDIAELIKEKDSLAYICIAGTKRPCLTCYSRMDSSGEINNYGKRPGLLYLGRYDEQIDHHPTAARKTLESAILKNYYLTIDEDGKENAMYDSGTDDEPGLENKTSTNEELYNKGFAYYKQQDYKKAFKWFKKAADTGYADAQNYLGCMYEDGEWIKKDYLEALKWYKIAADKKNKFAQYNLGRMYQYGSGMKNPNLKKAKKWYKLASDNDYEKATKALGRLSIKKKN